MRVKFQTIRYKNFLSVGNEFIEIRLDLTPTTLISGSNGHGKSSFIDAITFSLFDKVYRKTNKPLLVNSINGKNCVVEIEFLVGKKQYKVCRGIKPAIFEIYENGILLDQNAVRGDYQAHLEENILHFNYKAFTQIVILGSSFIPFMELTATDRRTVIEDLLDIKIFSQMKAVVLARLGQLKSQVDINRRDIELTQNKIDFQKKYELEAKKNNEVEIENNQKEKIAQKLEVDKLLVKNQSLQEEVNDLLASVKEESSLQSKLKQYEEIGTKIRVNRDKDATEQKFYLKNDNCPTCKQPIDDKFKQETIKEKNNKITEAEEVLGKLQKNLDGVKTQLEAIRAVQNKIRGLQQTISSNSASVAQIERYVKKIETTIENLSKKEGLSEDFVKISEELNKSLENLNEKQIRDSEEKNYYEYIFSLLKDDGIKARVVKQYLPVINKTVNKYLSILDFFVNFELDEEFNESIRSRHRDNFKFANFSEGEKSRINLALLFAWRTIAKLKSSMDTNLLIMDEVLDGSMDGDGIEGMFKLLEMLGENTNIFVITHKTEFMSENFTSAITFRKKGDFSEMERV